MNECYGKNFILNGILQPAETFDKSLVYEGDSIYEVLRMIKGAPGYFTDHMERLTMSVKLQKKEFITGISNIRKDIIRLIRSDKKRETNLKIIFNYNKGISNYLIYFIEGIYPTESQYQKGVAGILFSAERKDPESKVIDHKLRSSIYHRLIAEGAYEAILVNESNQITEGSRTNIFFLLGDTLVTAPDSIVLKGITRKHIIEICKENEIKLDYGCVDATDLGRCESVFMTGTSPMVLPFKSIDDYLFNVRNPLIEKLRTLYVKRAEESISLFHR